MKKEAEEYAEEDKKAKERVETLNMADTMCFGIEKSMNEFGDKITNEQKESINTQITKIREAIKNDNLDEVVSSQKELENIWNPIVSEIYKSQNTENVDESNAMNQFTEMFGGNSKNPFGGGSFGQTNNPFAN